jgi:hypothetical protein
MSEDTHTLLPARRRFDVIETLWRLFASAELTALLLATLALLLVVNLLFSPTAEPGGPTVARQLGQYPALQNVLNAAGLLELPRSIWLRLVLGTLTMNVLVSIADRLPTAWRRLRAESPMPPEQNLGQLALVESSLSIPAEETVHILQKTLEKEGFRFQSRRKGVVYIWSADRSAWAWSGPIFFYLGLLTLVAGLALAGRLAWREEGIALAPQQEYQIKHTSFTLRLDDLNREPGLGEVPSKGQSPAVVHPATVSILQDGRVVEKGSVAPGRAFEALGLTLFQSNYRPVVQVRVSDAGGALLAVQTFADEASKPTAPRLSFSGERSERYFTVPSRALSFRLVFYHSLPEQGLTGPVFLVQVYRAADLDPTYSTFIEGSGNFTYGDLRCEFTLGYDPVLGVTWDPGRSVVFLGAILVTVGLVLSNVVFPITLWGSVEEKDSGALVTAIGEAFLEAEALRWRLTDQVSVMKLRGELCSTRSPYSA